MTLQKGAGVVVRRTKGFYRLRTECGEEVECKIKGKLFEHSRFDNQVAVGDRVTYTLSTADSFGLIDRIEKRDSFLSRSRVGIEAEQVIAANVDYLFLVCSVKNPAFRYNLVNRMLVASNVGQIDPVLVVSKTDLSDEMEIDRLIEPYRRVDMEIVPFSTEIESEDTKLLELMSGSVSVLVGKSGTGKSSLLNKLFPGLNLKVGSVSSKTSKGSHTTTFASMHEIAKNSYVIDTPGIREFGLWQVTRENLGEYYPLVREYRFFCKHRNCRHVHEPECAVKRKVEEGVVSGVLYRGYVSIFDSLD